MPKQLGTIPLPELEQRAREGATLGSRLAQSGLLDSDDVAVDALASKPADVTLNGLITRSKLAYPAIVGTELQEIGSATTNGIPLYRTDGSTTGSRWQKSGWYDVESEDVARAHTAVDDVWEYRLSLTRSGTRGSHFRSVAVNEQTITHPFGSDLTSLVGLPASARKVCWYDRDTQETSLASPTDSVESVVGTIDRYNASAGQTALSADRVALLYDVSYQDDAAVGVRSYDTRGFTYKFDADGERQWQTIYETGHDVDDPIALSNGLIRLRVSEPDNSTTGTLSAERYDSTTDAWNSVSLPASDWEPIDLDITEIGQHREAGQLVFEHPTAGLYRVRFSLSVGYQDILFGQTQTASSSIPSGLESLLDPIATASTIDENATRTLTSKRNLR